MKWKQLIATILVFLTFLGTGAMLSNIQSREADQLLQAHGLSYNSRYLKFKKKTDLASFLFYLDKNFKKHRLQIHFDDKQNKGRVLVWANKTVTPLPTENGRYFVPDDFTGQLSFAVLGPDAKVAKYETQGNTYIHIGRRYYSVIGQLKGYRQIEQHKYYLSTGISQPTAKNSLQNYRVIIDGNNKVLQKIKKHYHAKMAIPGFVKHHRVQRLSVLKEILFILIFWLAGMSSNLLLALLERRKIKTTHLRGNLLRNWILNRSFRLLLGEGAVAIIAYFFLRGHAFYRRVDHLALLLLLSWLIVTAAYLLFWYRYYRKERRFA